MVLFGFDVPSSAREGLLGFAIHRTDEATGQGGWFPNLLRFKANDRPGGPASSQRNPLQAFQWGDYGVTPGRRYCYRIQSLYGTPSELRVGESVAIEIATERQGTGRHGIYFNRGVAGSQAYARRFADVSPLESADARQWLSRGLEEALLRFIDRAEGSDWAIRGALYEFKHERVLKALLRAAKRGAQVELVVALPEKGGKPSYPSPGNLEAIEKTGVEALIIKRRRATGIPHNKFLVLVRDNEPIAVWTGSTNITAGAIYGHSNVGHRVSDAGVAATYLAYWEQLKSDPETSVLRTFDEEAANVPEDLPPPGTLELFSPRSGQGELRWFAKLMGEAKQAVFLTAPFGITTLLEEVLRAPRDYPRYVLLDKEDDHGAELRRADPDNQLAASAFVPGGGFGQFIEEGLTGLNKAVLFIHTKYLLIDPLTEDPVVITGSANFSPASVTSNDENMLVIRGDTRVTDIYLTEFMRLFTHMRFRRPPRSSPTSGLRPRQSPRCRPRFGLTRRTLGLSRISIPTTRSSRSAFSSRAHDATRSQAGLSSLAPGKGSSRGGTA